MNTLLCPWNAPTYLFFSNNVPSLLFYSHVPSMLISLLFATFVFSKNKGSAVTKLLLIITSLFFAWSFIDLILWSTNSPDNVIFFWSLQVLIEPLIFLLSLVLTYRFIFSTEPTIKAKLLVLAPLIPLIVFLPTKFNLIGVNLSDCTAIEGFFAHYYSYIFETIYIFLIVLIVHRGYKQNTDTKRKKEIRYFGIGIILFLIAFSWGNIIGSFSSNWQIAQIGLIGMPIFVGFLSYLIVEFKSFNIKLLASQALVWGLVILIGSQFFFIKSPINRVLNTITFAAGIVFAQYLIKSVKREIEHRKQIEQLADQRENFIHFLSHEVKAILGKNIDMFDMIVTTNTNTTQEQIASFAHRSLTDTRSALDMVENILHSNEVKDGKISMNMKPFDLKDALLETINSLKLDAESKGLTIETKIDSNRNFVVLGDKENIAKHVIRNLIDNSIRYTEKGGLIINLSKKLDSVLLSIKDTGVGITKEDMSKLFTEGGHGKDSLKVNIHSTGYGLYFAKGIVDAHKGKIWAESDGAGKGTTFYLELKSN